MSSPIKSDFKPVREREYRLYLLWKSLPIDFIRGGREHLLSAGIDDYELLELSDVKTQKQFAEKYELNEDTLVIWNKQPIPAEYREMDWRYWARKLTPRIIGFLFEGIKAEKDAARIKLWLQTVDGYVEESRINGDVSTETLKGIREIAEAMKARDPNPQPSAPPDETDDDEPGNVDIDDTTVENEGGNVGRTTSNDSGNN